MNVPDIIAVGFVLLGVLCLVLADWKAPESRR